jgi:hypothetical protein
MKSAGVFVGGLTSVLTVNLMLVGVCSSAPMAAAPALPPPLPVPPPVVRSVAVEPRPLSEPIPWGTFIWGCGGHISVDPEGAWALPICLNRGR